MVLTFVQLFQVLATVVVPSVPYPSPVSRVDWLDFHQDEESTTFVDDPGAKRLTIVKTLDLFSRLFFDVTLPSNPC